MHPIKQYNNAVHDLFKKTNRETELGHMWRAFEHVCLIYRVYTMFRMLYQIGCLRSGVVCMGHVKLEFMVSVSGLMCWVSGDICSVSGVEGRVLGDIWSV